MLSFFWLRCGTLIYLFMFWLIMQIKTRRICICAYLENSKHKKFKEKNGPLWSNYWEIVAQPPVELWLRPHSDDYWGPSEWASKHTALCTQHFSQAQRVSASRLITHKMPKCLFTIRDTYRAVTSTLLTNSIALGLAISCWSIHVWCGNKQQLRGRAFLERK